MVATLKIELEFESWFEKDREPKSKEEWTEFFNIHLLKDTPIIGFNDGIHQDIIDIDNYSIECTDIDDKL